MKTGCNASGEEGRTGTGPVAPSCISPVITNTDVLAWDGAEKPAGPVRSRGPATGSTVAGGWELGRCTYIIRMSPSEGLKDRMSSRGIR